VAVEQHAELINAVDDFCLVQNFGLEQINHFFPNIDKSEIWVWTKHFFHNYGIIVLFLVGLTPFSQQPVLILSALSDHSFLTMGVAIFLSRIIKFSFMAYIATHAPQFIEKFWGLKTELRDVGIKID
jgi:membrane protein YqaA with SNARE-associated domain